MSSRRIFVPVRVNDVDVDKTKSPWGYVVLNIPGRAKEKWKHFFKSRKEFEEFFKIWETLDAPYVMEVDDRHSPRSYWRKHEECV